MLSRLSSWPHQVFDTSEFVLFGLPVVRMLFLLRIFLEGIFHFGAIFQLKSQKLDLNV